jgi:phytoene dehydrogenase-like protein
MTATLSCIPAHLINGGWTDAARSKLAAIALEAAERAMPDVAQLVLAQHVVTGPDIENALGATNGDFDGGELAPDQALGYRPFGEPQWQEGRTPVHGLYLCGPSSAAAPFLLGISGERAALAAAGDFKAGHLR